MENAFGILKSTFRELLTKSKLYVAFLTDVILAYAILHNILLGQSYEDVENLLQVLRIEGLDGKVSHNNADGEDGGDGVVEPTEASPTTEIRNELGIFLTIQRLNQH